MRSEKLFELLDDSGASTLTMIPRNQDGKALGVIVVVRESSMDEFLLCLEEHWTPGVTPSADDSPPDDDDNNYGWDT